MRTQNSEPHDVGGGDEAANRAMRARGSSSIDRRAIRNHRAITMIGSVEFIMRR